MRKTIKEWLEELPDGYRERALNHAANNTRELAIEKSIDGALAGGFVWKETLEGKEFWHDVAMHYSSDLPLPPLP